MLGINGKITSYIKKRMSRFCYIPPQKKISLRHQKLKIFKIPNPKFNALPINLRDLKRVSFQTLKRSLDDFLSPVQDEPMVVR